MSNAPADEVRFRFGMNWARFLRHLNEQRIVQAEKALSNLVGEVRGRSFLDIGCGSGIHSLAAMHAGAARVHSFDFDPESVGCTLELKRRYYPENEKWTIARGSALDSDYVRSLGGFDVVYSWGVLHHTGNMWRALELAAQPVAPGGKLAVAIYNDQGFVSRYWKQVKHLCNRLPAPLRPIYIALVISPVEAREMAKAALRLRPQQYVHRWTRAYSHRGMNRWHDIVDWVGGYPFEVAKPEQIFDFYRARGFVLDHLTTCGNSKACNELVFHRPGACDSPDAIAAPATADHNL